MRLRPRSSADGKGRAVPFGRRREMGVIRVEDWQLTGNAPPCDQRSTEWNEEDEEFPKRASIQTSQEALHTTNFSRSYVPTKNTATGSAIQEAHYAQCE